MPGPRATARAEPSVLAELLRESELERCDPRGYR